MASWLLPTIDFLGVSRGHYVFVSAHGWSYLLLDNILFNGLLSKSDVLFLWTSHRELDCPCMKKARGRPSYQLNKQPAVKAGRSVFLEILAEPHNTRDFLRHSCGNCKWDWSKYVISSVATFHAISLRHPAPDTDRIWNKTLPKNYVYVQRYSVAPTKSQFAP